MNIKENKFIFSRENTITLFIFNVLPKFNTVTTRPLGVTCPASGQVVERCLDLQNDFFQKHSFSLIISKNGIR